MKEYLKMADVFELPVSADTYRVDFAVISDDKDIIIGGFGIEGVSGAAAHAINSHDELVAEVERLRYHLMACATELVAMIDAHNVQNMDDGSWKYDHQTPWEAMQLLR